MRKWFFWLILLAILAAAAGWGITRLVLPKIPTKPSYTQADYESGRRQIQDFWNRLLRSPGSASVLSLNSNEVNALLDRELSRMVLSTGRQLEGVAVKLGNGTVNLESAVVVPGGTLGFGIDLKPATKDGGLRFEIIEARVAGLPVPTSRLLQEIKSRVQLPSGVGLDPDGTSLVISNSLLGASPPSFESVEVTGDGMKLSMKKEP